MFQINCPHCQTMSPQKLIQLLEHNPEEASCPYYIGRFRCQNPNCQQINQLKNYYKIQGVDILKQLNG